MYSQYTALLPEKVLVSEIFGAEMKKILNDATKMAKLIKVRFTEKYFKNYVEIWTKTI